MITPHPTDVVDCSSNIVGQAMPDSVHVNAQKFRDEGCNFLHRLKCRSALLSRQKEAFTLAEVLITLTIIGVVAAVTVPTLTKKIGNQEFVTRLMKANSVLSQATEAIILEKGSPKHWSTDIDNVYDLYKKHLRESKDCGSSEGCFKQGVITYLNGAKSTHNNTLNNYDTRTELKKLILADGSQLIFGHYGFSTKCNLSDNVSSKDFCAMIQIDINGSKSPNIMGRDVFSFVLKEDGLHPRGCDFTNVCNTDNEGFGCACKVITEGEMNY